VFTSEADWLVAAGKEQGEMIAGYLMCRMQEGRITPMEAVSIVAVLLEKQAEEMVSAGTSQGAALL
jgi:hypothetical protein